MIGRCKCCSEGAVVADRICSAGKIVGTELAGSRFVDVTAHRLCEPDYR